MNADPNHYEGRVRTDMYCHNCGKNFVAILDFDINGNHEIVCPHCGHEHCRVITDGVITGDRWDSRWGESIKSETQCIWTHSVLKATTSSVSQFLRDRWLNREGA
jgi:DNA-directed RNA polymerase subunit RPC12/RpoP